MKETFFELINYIKNPVLEEDPNTDFKYRLKKLLHLLVFCLATGLLLTPVFILIQELGLVNMEEHTMEYLIIKFSKPYIFFFVVIVFPFFEELIFRAPLTLFKNPKVFKRAFYTLVTLFGLMHLPNYNLTTNVLLLTPILVAPQIISGSYFAFIRVRFGLIWSMALHGFYNGIFMFITLATDLY